MRPFYRRFDGEISDFDGWIPWSSQMFPSPIARRLPGARCQWRWDFGSETWERPGRDLWRVSSSMLNSWWVNADEVGTTEQKEALMNWEGELMLIKYSKKRGNFFQNWKPQWSNLCTSCVTTRTSDIKVHKVSGKRTHTHKKQAKHCKTTTFWKITSSAKN